MNNIDDGIEIVKQNKKNSTDYLTYMYNIDRILSIIFSLVVVVYIFARLVNRDVFDSSDIVHISIFLLMVILNVGGMVIFNNKKIKIMKESVDKEYQYLKQKYEELEEKLKRLDNIN
ncbi:MAG: hypothetical protein FWF56_00885 [Firmicutes bacterium]|nr:hypothetical protein [Bacillota bacterium]MCL1953629.1 hypothetical protein [Bacillota bacterium]